jgi:predicted nucleotidyltransferase
MNPIKILSNWYRGFVDNLYFMTAYILKNMGYSNEAVQDALSVLFEGNIKLLINNFKKNRLDIKDGNKHERTTEKTN